MPLKRTIADAPDGERSFKTQKCSAEGLGPTGALIDRAMASLEETLGIASKVLGKDNGAAATSGGQGAETGVKRIRDKESKLAKAFKSAAEAVGDGRGSALVKELKQKVEDALKGGKKTRAGGGRKRRASSK